MLTPYQEWQREQNLKKLKQIADELSKEKKQDSKIEDSTPFVLPQNRKIPPFNEKINPFFSNRKPT